MGVVKVLELVGESNNGFEDAIQQAVHRAGSVVNGITGVEVLNMTADVQGNEIMEYKANIKVAYLADDGEVRGDM